MNQGSRQAKWIGFLFLLAMAVSIAGNLLLLPLVNQADFLTAIAASESRVRLAAELMLINSIAVVGIGALAYPMLREKNAAVAVGYAAARIVESIVLIIGIINILSLTGIAQQFVQQDSSAGDYLLSLGKAAINNNWHAYHIAMIALGLGSLPFCLTLLRSCLIPRNLALLGIASYGILAGTSLLAILDVEAGLLATLPVFVFEVSVGCLLLLKGFTPPAEALHRER